MHLPANPQARNESALAGLETRLAFVDHIGAATAANHAVIAVAAFKGLERIDDFHWDSPLYYNMCHRPDASI